jgi:hypothetical protein
MVTGVKRIAWWGVALEPAAAASGRFLHRHALLPSLAAPCFVAPAPGELSLDPHTDSLLLLCLIPFLESSPADP